MTGLLVLLSGAMFGLGIFLLLSKHGRRSTWPILTAFRAYQFRLAQIAIPIAFGVTLMITGWIVVSVSVAVLVSAIPGIGRPYIQTRNEQELVDGIATWTEQLRDTLAGAHGLEQAIVATYFKTNLIVSFTGASMSHHVGIMFFSCFN